MNDEKFSGNLSRLDEAIPSVALFHVVDVARFMCASLTRVFQRESLSLSSPLSLFYPFSSSLLVPFVATLVSPAPSGVHHPHHQPVFSSRTSSFFYAGLRAVQSPRKVFVWRFRRGRLFSHSRSANPSPSIPSRNPFLVRTLSPLRCVYLYT